MTKMTRQEFVTYTDNWGSHQPLLWLALESTNGTVFEFGCGHNSTPKLMKYCIEHGRSFFSYENKKDWIEEMKGYGVLNVENYEDIRLQNVDVLFIDHAPGERRKVDIERWRNHAKIIIAHDTEPSADHGYKMRPVLKRFKYMKDFETDGAWATAVSNYVDVTKWQI